MVRLGDMYFCGFLLFKYGFLFCPNVWSNRKVLILDSDTNFCSELWVRMFVYASFMMHARGL